MCLIHAQVCLSEMVVYGKAEPTTPKCLSNIRFSMKLNQNQSKYSSSHVL